jgi:hypothetical protein
MVGFKKEWRTRLQAACDSPTRYFIAMIAALVAVNLAARDF